MTDTVRSQIRTINDLGFVNMYEWLRVHKVACDLGFYELVLYIEDDPARYFYYILHGEEHICSSSRRRKGCKGDE